MRMAEGTNVIRASVDYVPSQFPLCYPDAWFSPYCREVGRTTNGVAAGVGSVEVDPIMYAIS